MGSIRDAISTRIGRADEARTADDESAILDLADEIAANPQTVELRDGRTLGYAEVGDPGGKPLVFFHGFPNSRVLAALFDEVGREEGIRVIAPERPGMGISDPDPDRVLTDWPADVSDLVDELGIEQFAVLGISGGGPYVAVTAAKLPDRVERAGIVCGVGPMASVGVRERLWYYLARFLPAGSKLAIWLLARQARGDREEFLEEMASDATPSDEELWTGPVGQVIHASMIESIRHHGLDPLVTETAIYGSPWGFALDEIEVPVTLWYGKADVLVPPEMGLYLAREIPTAESHIYPDLDHLATVDENETEIFRTLAG